MTPLAMKVANELTLPLAQRTFDDRADVLKHMLSSDFHCFEVSAVRKSIEEAMKENIWDDAVTMIPRTFLPSPVTWLESIDVETGRHAWVVEEAGSRFRLSLVSYSGADLFSMPMCLFWDAGSITSCRIGVEDLTETIDDRKPWERDPNDVRLGSDVMDVGLPIDDRVTSYKARAELLDMRVKTIQTTIGRMTELQRVHNSGIIFVLLVLDLINTPGLIGLRKHDPHRGLVRKLGGLGRYPLKGWSEIVLKHQTKFALGIEDAGGGYHKCLHFVRSHLRRYKRDGRVTVIPAHWRGDPALGIKRTRYRLAA